MKNIVLFIALLLTSAFADNNAMVSQMSSAFLGSFTSIFIPLLIFGTIISIGLSMAKRNRKCWRMAVEQYS